MNRHLFFLLWLFFGQCQAEQPEIITPIQRPYVTMQNGEPSGPLIDLIRAMATLAGLPDHVTVLPPLRWRHDYLSGQHIMPFLNRQPDREDQFIWIAPAIDDCGRFVTIGEAAPITSLDQARQLRAIAVPAQGSTRDALVAQGFTNLEGSADDDQNARKLINGRVDAWFGLGSLQAALLPTMTSKPIHYSAPMVDLHMWVAASKDTPQAVIDRLRDAHERLRRTGQLNSILSPLKNTCR